MLPLLNFEEYIKWEYVKQEGRLQAQKFAEYALSGACCSLWMLGKLWIGLFVTLAFPSVIKIQNYWAIECK